MNAYVHGYADRERERLDDQAGTLVELLHGDIAFPAGALRGLLKPGGTIIVIEGDHGSTFFHPDSQAAQTAIGCQVELQARSGGNAMIGRQVYGLLDAAGFDAVAVSPRMVYVDASLPHLVDGFTRRTFTAMIEGVGPSAISAGLIDAESFEVGIRALHRTTEPDGMFSYTFFKAVAVA